MSSASPTIYCHLCEYVPHQAHEIRQVWYHDRLVVECLRSGRKSEHSLRKPVPTHTGMSTPIAGSEVM